MQFSRFDAMIQFEVRDVRVAICDDDKLSRARLIDIATDYAEQRRDQTITFVQFSDPQSLLDAVCGGDSFDIYILDIIMPGMDGIQLGKALREKSADSKIIYLSSSKEYALDSYRVRAFDYLLKPIEKNAFYRAMDDAIASLHIKRDKSLIIKTKECSARVTYDSILCAELSKRVVVYHLVGDKTVESTTVRGSFADSISNLLADQRFVLSGQSMVVNLDHVTEIETDAVVLDGTYRASLGEKICRKLRSVWSKYLFDGEW